MSFNVLKVIKQSGFETGNIFGIREGAFKKDQSLYYQNKLKSSCLIQQYVEV